MAVEMNQIIDEVVVVDRTSAGANAAVQSLQRVETASDGAAAATQRVSAAQNPLANALVNTSRASASAATAWARWQAQADPAVRDAQRLARAQADIDRAVRQGLAGQEQAARVLAQLQQRYAATATANDNVARSSGRMGNAVQQAGFQIGDFAVQVASGQSPMRAFIQQGTQMISMFGPWGAIIGAAGAVLGALIVNVNLFGDAAVAAAKAQDRLTTSIGAANSVLETHRSLGAALATQREDEIQDVANLAIYYSNLTERKRQLAQVELQLRQVELTREQGGLGTVLAGSVVGAQDYLTGSTSIERAGSPEIAAALTQTRDLMDEIRTATDLSSEAIAGYAVRFNELAGPGGALAQAAAGAQGQEVRRLAQVQERFDVTLQTLIDVAQLANSAETELDAVGTALEVINAPPDEQAYLASLPGLLNDAADAAEAAQRELDRMQEASARRELRLDDYIGGLEQTNALEQLSTEEKAVQEALLRAQAILVDEQGQAVRDLTAEEERRIRVAIETRDAIRAQREAQEEMRKVVESTTDDVVDYGRDAVKGFFGDTEDGWKQMWNRIKGTALDALADMVAQFAIRPIVAPIVAQIVGAAPGAFGISGGSSGGGSGLTGAIGGLTGGSSGGGGILGGLFNMPTPPISSLFGNSGAIGSFLNTPIIGGTSVATPAGLPFGAAPGAFTSGGLTIGGALGGVGIGASIGGLLSSLTGGNQLGGSIGGGLGGLAGAAIGSVIPGVGTILGSVAGGALGGFIGGLFGGGTSVGPNGNTNIDVRDGRLAVTQTGVDNGADPQVTIAAARRAVDYINALVDQFDLGVRPIAHSFIRQGEGTSLGYQSDQAFVDAFIRQGLVSDNQYVNNAIALSNSETIVENLTTVTELLTLLDDIDLNPDTLTQAEQAIAAINERFEDLVTQAERFGISTEQLEQAREAAILGLTEDFNRGIELQILAFTNPLQQQLEALSDAQEQRVREAEALGADLVEVERLAALEREAVIKQSIGDLRAWLDGQAITSTATTGVGRLAEAQAQFGDVLDAIRNGEASAQNLSQVTGLADTIIALAGELYGGTAQHAALEQMVRSQIESIGRDLGLPGFASGGDHMGGWRRVGEFGPELEFTPPSRIYSAPDSAALLGASREERRQDARLMHEQTAEIRALREENAGMRAAVERLTRQLDRLLNKRAA